MVGVRRDGSGATISLRSRRSSTQSFCYIFVVTRYDYDGAIVGCYLQVFKVLVELSILLFQLLLGVSEAHGLLSAFLAEVQRWNDFARYGAVFERRGALLFSVVDL